MFGIKLIPIQGHEWCLIQTGQNHCVTTEAQKHMAIVKQAEKQVRYRPQMNTDSKFMHTNNTDITMLIFFCET